MKRVTPETAIEDFFKYLTSSLYTALPCRVISVRTELNDQRVDVQPLNNRILPDGSSKEHSSILNVPVIFPSSAKASVTFPIDVGDTVLCVFSQRSIDSFKASSDNNAYTAQDKRRFDSRDAVAIPGLFSFKRAINNPNKHKWTHSTRDLVMVNNLGSNTECEIRLKDNGNIELRTDQDFYAKFNNGLVECNNLTIDASGDFTVTAGGNIDMTATSDMAITAATWTVNISGTTTVNAPVTNWTGIFNLAGTLAMAPGGGGSGTATISAPLTVTAPMTVEDNITVTGGDVVADGISLKSHVHPGDSGGTTGTPQ